MSISPMTWPILNTNQNSAYGVEAEESLQRYFDLTLYETRAYLTLLRKGSLKAKDVAEASGIPLPRVYDTLSSLRAKGFVEDLGGFFRAVSPKLSLHNALLLFQEEFERKQEERRLALENIVRQVEGVQKAEETHVVLLRGLNSIVSRLIEVVTNSDELFFIIRKALKVKPLFKSVLIESGISAKKIRVLLPHTIRLEKDDLDTITQLKIQVRLSEFPLIDLLVGGKKYVMIGVPEAGEEGAFSAIALYVVNSPFARSLLASLEEQWRVAKPLAVNEKPVT